jgi:A/G-specific adenine glycosylase
MERFPDVESLAAASEDEVLRLWEGLGYYSRGRNLLAAARQIAARGSFPDSLAEIRALKGVGDYTAAAIGSIAFGQPRPAVDGNVLRVLSRVLASPADIAMPAVKTAMENALAPHYPDGQTAGDLNQAFMDLGATICLPHGEPHCAHCPLARICLAHAEGLELELPQKSSARQRRQEKHTILLLRQGDTIALHQRPAKGLLAGLWEFPNLPCKLTKKEITAWLEENGWHATRLLALPPDKHIFSHIEWQISGWLIELASDTGLIVRENNLPFVWANPQEIAEHYSLPSAFQYYSPYILRNKLKAAGISFANANTKK